MREVTKQEQEIIAELKGTALRIFLFLLKNREIGIREVQRKLGLKSASNAQYHLQRFEHLGIVEKNVNSRYTLTEKYSELRTIKLGLLTEIFIFRGRIVPSLGFISGSLFSTLILSIVIYFQVDKLAGYIISLIGLFATMIYFLVQTTQIIQNFTSKKEK